MALGGVRCTTHHQKSSEHYKTAEAGADVNGVMGIMGIPQLLQAKATRQSTRI